MFGDLNNVFAERLDMFENIQTFKKPASQQLSETFFKFGDSIYFTIYFSQYC